MSLPNYKRLSDALVVLMLLCPAGVVSAQGYDAGVPEPTRAEVRYGPHERNVLDFWQAQGDGPRPLVFIIHGGGWTGGNKERAQRFADVPRLLESGVSVVAINYRLIPRGPKQQGPIDTSEKPPVHAPLSDAARALQFVRSKAKEWNIDKTRVGAAGGSAGACSSLWLLYHDDLAEPDADDPVARESTRLSCAAVKWAQTTLDPEQMKRWTPNSRYGGHAFGLNGFKAFLEAREQIKPWIDEYSPYALASEDDPPVYMQYGQPPNFGKAEKDPTHSANFGVGLKERCKALGLSCVLSYPGADAKYDNATTYLIAALTAKAD